MSKPTGSIAEQLAALGLSEAGPAASASKKSPKQEPDFGSKIVREPKAGDLEAAMAKKLAEAGGSRSEAGNKAPRYARPAKRNAPEFLVEQRKRPPSRSVEPNRTPQKQVATPKAPSGGLTAAAQERLRYEPEPTLDSEPIVGQKAAPAAEQDVEEPRTKTRERPGETRPLTFADTFVHITKIVAASTPAIEDRPTQIARVEALRLDEQVSRGAASLRDNPNPDLVDGYIIGFDFGTSALKVVFRDPHLAGKPVAALPAPDELCSRRHPYLWQTVVWFNRADSTFHLYPIPGAIALEGFKTGIVAGRGTEPICEEPVLSRAEAASAFVALHLCNLFGWYEMEKPLSRTKARNFLGVNIGVPVATSDDPVALQPFKEVVCAAVALAASCEPLNLDRVRATLKMAQDEDLPVGFELVPELSAALVGYASDPTSPWGAHVLIDVGASTLDIVAFNLVENDDEAQIKAFSASVELLGAAALEIAKKQGVTDEDFAKACNYQFGDTYGYACREDVALKSFSLKNPTREDVQLVVTGGGCATSVHSALIGELPGRILGPRDVARPEPPKAIAAIDCDRSRLLLAYGLAHDHPDIPHPTLPSRIPLIAPRPSNQSHMMIGPEQT